MSSSTTRNTPPNIPKIIFEDPHLMVISKPAGLLSQGEHTGDENLVDWARAHVGRNYVGLIHRLDRNTSGIMILAKRTKAAQRLTDQLQNGKLNRIYRAWLIGTLSTTEVRWQHFLLKDEKTNTVRVIPSSHPMSSQGKAKSASLKVKALQKASYQGQPLTLAEFTLETGRSHQIRAQAQAEGFPLLGDTKYGTRQNHAPHFPRPALHSYQIFFEHPMSHEPQTFVDDLPEDMRSISPLR